ncbi:dolichyl-phosphate beta-glucosyltransferase [Methanocella arvoryzae]|uniref:dolichyl-phosphate beta-glucosyltransferase n=1 Tax=Methanocella arvoryzae (strain DSM 22066 / NBRC 105507 / MRE50) TaxID=351160 RepID=Q0W7G5_METAR|nr:dolichyl-phosphate beta-glucosyltransferase [Methanocella arvoryzae]CAJ35678.1 glucosyltransferase (family 2) [Methanocella arvoryzae MRE50]
MISVIVPAYNEEDRIEKTLADYSEGLKSAGDFEIIVVCDGCKDRTPEIAAKYAKVLTFPNRLGKGGGVLEGFKVARGDIVGFTDADNSLKVDQFLKLIEEMKKTGAGCVIADRKSKEAIIVESQYLIRRLASESFNTLFPRLLFGLKIKDSQCGGKIFKREYVEKVAPLMVCSGFEFDVELLWRMKNAGCVIREVPVVWKDDKGSKFSFKYIPAMGVNLIKTRFGIMKKK